MTNTETATYRPLKIRFHAPAASVNDNDGSHEPSITSFGSEIRIRNIKARDRVIGGRRHEGKIELGHHAEIVPGKFIRLHGVETNRVEPVEYDRTFRIGDVVEHGSYNLSYTGRILSIGPSTVTVERTDIGSKPTRLTIAEFSWRNRTLDLEAVAKENAAWMD